MQSFSLCPIAVSMPTVQLGGAFAPCATGFILLVNPLLAYCRYTILRALMIAVCLPEQGSH